MSNILEVTFESGQTFATAERLWKGDYGQILLIHGPELPAYYEVHFSSTKDGTPEVSVGTPSGVQIPNRLLQAEGHIYAWVFLHAGENDGETKFQVKIPVEERGIPIDQETPEDQTAVQQAIAALNAETGRAEAAADAASVSELNAKASEDAALLSEQNAETAAQAAAASAENAALSEDGAAESEAAAAISAQEAAASAAAAAASAAEAGGSEETVAEYARQAGEAADTALQYGVLAVQSAQDAEASAQTAETYGEAAIEAKTTATTAAATATQKAQEASTNAGIAASHAATAVSKATEAVQSANEAAQSAADAANSADDADDSAASARLHDEQAQAASTAAQTAAGNASAAQTAAEAAQTAAEAAQDGAEDAQDAAEAAQSSAEAAQTAAEAAQRLAEAAQAAAENAAETLSGSIDQIAQNTDDIEDLQAEVLNMLPVDTADGPVASFPDGADGIPLKSLIVDINPVQDLHGQDLPYPAGGGKNVIPNEGTSQTIDGVTYTVNADGTVKANGTATADSIFMVIAASHLDAYLVNGNTYTLNGCPSGGSADTYFLYLNVSGARDTGSGANFTYNDTTPGNLTIRVKNGVQVNNIVFKPMIRLSSVSDATFAPYENLCPISGWDKVELGQGGKKLNNPQWWNIDGKYNKFFGVYTPGSANKSRGVYMKAGVTYHIYYDNGVSQQYGIYGARLGSTTQFNLTSNTTRRIVDVDFTPTVTDKYVFWGFTSANSFPDISTQIFQIEVGNSYTGDSSYNPASRYIIIQLGDTYYKAKLDVLTGVLRVLSRKIVITSADDVYAFAANSSGNYRARYYNYGNWFKNHSDGLYSVGLVTTASNAYNFASPNRFFTENTSVYVMPPKGITTEQAYKDWLDSIGGVEALIYYKTPVVVQLTPEQVNSLLGTNNIWANTGDTHAIYRADIGLYIQKLTGSEEDDMIANNAIASGKYFLVGNRLFLSTAAIAAGATLTPGTNCVETNLAAALNALNS